MVNSGTKSRRPVSNAPSQSKIARTNFDHPALRASRRYAGDLKAAKGDEHGVRSPTFLRAPADGCGWRAGGGVSSV
jgi:hypothetical protein